MITYKIEICEREQNTPEVQKAQEKEIQKLLMYEVFEEVNDSNKFAECTNNGNL